MFILKKGDQPGVYVPLRALFLVVVLLPFCVKRLVDIVKKESVCHSKFGI